MKRVLRSQHDFRKTILRNQLTSLVLYEAVTTTAAKSRLLAAYADHFFSRVKGADDIAKRYASQTLFDKMAIKKTFEEILPRYDKTASSYVRVLRVMPRAGDSAAMRLVSLQKPLTVAKVAPVAAEKTKEVAATVKPKATKPAKKVTKK